MGITLQQHLGALAEVVMNLERECGQLREQNTKLVVGLSNIALSYHLAQHRSLDRVPSFDNCTTEPCPIARATIAQGEVQ